MRPSWDEYFIEIARQIGTRSTCDRKHVGAVVVRDKQILSSGYNGSIRGLAHCDDAGHQIVDSHCVATVHAEANALIQAAKNGVSVDRSVVYVTAFPCWGCFKLMANAGVLRIVYLEAYRPDEMVRVGAATTGIILESMAEVLNEHD